MSSPRECAGAVMRALTGMSDAGRVRLFVMAWREAPEGRLADAAGASCHADSPVTRVTSGAYGRRSAARLALASAAWIMQESDRLRPCQDSRILTLRCCLVRSQPGLSELIEVPDFRGMQALNAWLFGHDRGLLLTGPDPDSSQPLLHGVVVDQAPVPGDRVHRWDVVTVWIRHGPGTAKVSANRGGLSHQCRPMR
jgi:hypothetical protein